MNATDYIGLFNTTRYGSLYTAPLDTPLPKETPMPESWTVGGYTNEVTFGSSTSSSNVGRITTKVVLLKAGHVGQVLVDGAIVRELKPRKTHAKAVEAAKAHVARRLAKAL